MLPLWCKFALEIIIVGGNSFLTSGLRGFRPSVVFVTRRSPLFRTRHKGLRTNRQTFFIFLHAGTPSKVFPFIADGQCAIGELSRYCQGAFASSLAVGSAGLNMVP